MTIKRNVIANYIGQAYVTLVGILFVPSYVKYMGAEAYGLVGFFAMMQAWFLLLDMGLTPTMSREVARFQGGAVDAMTLRGLLRTLEGIFGSVALLGMAGILASSGFIATKWLKFKDLSVHEVKQAIMLMAIITALRWICGLYRGAINGFEHLIWLNVFNIIITTFKFIIILPYFIYVGASPVKFFSYQLVVAIVECAVLTIKTYELMPKLGANTKLSWEIKPLASVLKFSLTVAFTGVVWVFLTQIDKLVLSKILDLAEYGYFSLAVLVAGGVTIVGGPISGALLPRMTKLNAEGDEAGLIRLYRNATQAIAIIVIPITIILALFAEQVLWAWTGDASISHKAAPILSLYVIGNGILALAAFPYYLQFSKGDLKLHLIGNILFVIIFLPSLIWATRMHGAIGAGYAWVFANLVPFSIWLPIVHRRFVKGLHLKWLFHDLLPVVISTGIVVVIIRELIIWPISRISVSFIVISISVILFLAAFFASSYMRGLLLSGWQIRRNFPKS
ncbi:MAG: oligosaccharide flippase family protein [Desulfuromonadales bacterium]